MNKYILLTDSSVNPQLKTGVGAYLFLPYSILESFPEEIVRKPIVKNILFKKFSDTSSTELEIKTCLWALEDYQYRLEFSNDDRINLYTDSNNIATLLFRRDRLEDKAFLSKSTGKELRNTDLYQLFFNYHDKLDFDVIKVKGHTKQTDQDIVHRLFSFLDKAVRRELRIWIKEGNFKVPENIVD